MRSDQINRKSLFTLRSIAFALIIALFATFVFMAFPNALSGGVSDVECIGDSAECITNTSQQPNYAIWIGIYLCSLLGLILMTFKSTSEYKSSTKYISLASAAALNTLMWMAFVYAGAFLIKLF